VWREVRAKRFPAPVALSSNRIGWNSASIAEWIAARQPKNAEAL
jgi:predicted DNA-binding transcriptional regulator AlpA